MINAGGLINIAEELQPGGYSRERALAQVEAIPTTLAEVFERAEREGIPSHALADRIARERIEAARARQLHGAAQPARAAAVLSAIVWPAVFAPGQELDLSPGNLRILAALIATAVAWRTRSIIATIATGMAALWLLQAAVGI